MYKIFTLSRNGLKEKLKEQEILMSELKCDNMIYSINIMDTLASNEGMIISYTDNTLNVTNIHDHTHVIFVSKNDGMYISPKGENVSIDEITLNKYTPMSIDSFFKARSDFTINTMTLTDTFNSILRLNTAGLITLENQIKYIIWL